MLISIEKESSLKLFFFSSSQDKWSRDGTGAKYGPMHTKPISSAERATFGVLLTGLIMAVFALLTGAVVSIAPAGKVGLVLVYKIKN